MIRWILLLSLISCASLRPEPRAKNHIFFIVDGMGHAHITGARIYSGGQESRLTLESLPVVGLVRTYSSNDFTTDSASSATAYASGIRTANRFIGLSDPESSPTNEGQRLETITQKAQQAGKSVGIVTTTRITHATPAAYFAYVPHRNQEALIADQLLEANIDLIIGGGKDFFLPKDLGGKREDSRNLLQEFKDRHYRVITDYNTLTQQNPRDTSPLLAVLDNDHLPYDLDRKADELPLEDLVAFAINVLSQNPKGYLLIVEPGRVDHASHMNWARHAFGDMLAFDRSLKRTLELVGDDTLLLVTADHETGGLALNGYAPLGSTKGNKLLMNQTRDFANDRYNHGLISWASGPGFESPTHVDPNQENFRHRAAYPSPRGSAYHTAVDVPVFAKGPGQELFTGVHNNKDLVHIVLKLMGLPPLNN